jgi:hypothetical protein
MKARHCEFRAAAVRHGTFSSQQPLCQPQGRGQYVYSPKDELQARPATLFSGPPCWHRAERFAAAATTTPLQ